MPKKQPAISGLPLCSCDKIAWRAKLAWQQYSMHSLVCVLQTRREPFQRPRGTAELPLVSPGRLPACSTAKVQRRWLGWKRRGRGRVSVVNVGQVSVWPEAAPIAAFQPGIPQHAVRVQLQGVVVALPGQHDGQHAHGVVLGPGLQDLRLHHAPRGRTFPEADDGLPQLGVQGGPAYTCWTSGCQS